MYFQPMPMKNRICSICSYMVRFFRENIGEALDLYSCKCHRIYQWDGHEMKLVEKAVYNPVYGVRENAQLRGLPVETKNYPQNTLLIPN